MHLCLFVILLFIFLFPALVLSPYKDSLAYVSFNNEKQQAIDIGNVNISHPDHDFLTNTNHSNVFFLPGPVNAAQCMFGGVGTVKVAVIQDECVVNFNGCPGGYHFAYWVFLNERNTGDQEVVAVVFYQHRIKVKPAINNKTSNASVNIKMASCDVIEHVLGLRTWNHVTVIVAAGGASYDLYINGEMIATAACEDLTAGLDRQKILLGENTCMDEFVVASNDVVGDPVGLYYTSIVKGKCGSAI